jgi:hypothetical protein
MKSKNGAAGIMRGTGRGGWLLFSAIFIAAAAVRLYGLGGRVLFGDDALTHWFVLMPAGKVLAAAAGERTPPLSLLLAHFWLKLAPHYSEFWLRLPFAALNAASMFWLYGLGRAIGGRAAARAACILFALSPLVVGEAQMARYPSLEIFVTLASLYYLERYVRGGGAADLVCFSTALAAGLYTHYFMILFAASLAAGIAVSMSGRRRLLSLAGVAAAFVSFVPWFSRFAGRASSEVGYVGARRMAEYLETKPFFAVPHVFEQYLLGGYTLERTIPALFVLLAACVAVVFVYFVIRAKRDRFGVLLLFVTLLPPAAAWILKITIDFPLVTFPQFSVNIAPLFFLCLAVGWSRMGRAAGAAAAAPVLASVLIALAAQLGSLGLKDNTADALRLADERKRPGDVLLMLPPECAPLVQFYGPRDIPSFGITADLDPLQYNAAARAKRPPLDDAYLAGLARRISAYGRAWVLWCGGTTAQPDPHQRILNFMDSNYEPVLQKKFIFNAGMTEPGALLKLYKLHK